MNHRFKLMMLALVATFALCGITASSSTAACVQVEEEGTGNYNNAACEGAMQAGKWIKVKRILLPSLGNNQFCAETTEANKGNWGNSTCAGTKEVSNFIKVFLIPIWNVNGAPLTSGTKQIKLQTKGSAVLSFEIGTEKVSITCNNSVSEGAAIEGNGSSQGQGKGRISFTSCKVSDGCPVAEPLVTRPLKTHLVTFKGTQSPYAELFEPTEGATLTTLKLGGACLLSLAMTGSVAAEVMPKEAEGQEGLLNFPATPIAVVFLEGMEKKIGLFLSAKEMRLAAAYGTRLATNEPFGVFPN